VLDSPIQVDCSSAGKREGGVASRDRAHEEERCWSRLTWRRTINFATGLLDKSQPAGHFSILHSSAPFQKNVLWNSKNL